MFIFTYTETCCLSGMLTKKISKNGTSGILFSYSLQPDVKWNNRILRSIFGPVEDSCGIYTIQSSMDYEGQSVSNASYFFSSEIR